MEFVRSAYDFLLDLMRMAVVFLKRIPTPFVILGHQVYLFEFLIGVLVLGVVIAGAVNIVKAPANVAATNRSIRESEARSEARYQRHREERRQKLK